MTNRKELLDHGTRLEVSGLAQLWCQARDGFVMGEGAGVLCLEALQSDANVIGAFSCAHSFISESGPCAYNYKPIPEALDKLDTSA